MTAPRCADAADAWTLTSRDGLQIRILGHGASWVGCKVPLRDGASREVLLGFDDLDSQRRNRAYVGATVGRWANRIAGLKLRQGERSWTLASEPGLNHQLHGGPGGFHQREWTLLELADDRIRLGLHSADGDQGFPGDLDVEVLYRLLPGHTVEIDYRARLGGNRASPVGLTNHAYFQLDGHDDVDVRQQRLQVTASRVLPVDGSGLPTGAPVSVASPDAARLDYQASRVIGQPLDNAFLLEEGIASMARAAATLKSRDRLLAMDLFTTLPALQVYTGEFLASGTRDCHPQWPAFSGIALEPQYLPDSPHHPEWPQPDCWLRPGAVWAHRIRYRFRT
ncbi:galactose-1-epimerase [Roseateles sp. YR242]|uniref:galactose-1-epimerase n=1 Tax=Roseateles sp. YR242 TaxID=1855305 RepID=UPI0015A66C5F|nr:galactose-1-epimerase [Roseateles sp. YR242]